MELNEKDLELIAKIDERLKHYNLITDNEQADYNWQKQIELNKKPKPLTIAPAEWKVGHCGENSSIHKDNIPNVSEEMVDHYSVTKDNGEVGLVHKNHFLTIPKEVAPKTFIERLKEVLPKETEQKERWKPQLGQLYWFLESDLSTCDSQYSDKRYHQNRLECGNCFKTQEEAERAAQAIRETLKNL